MDPSLASQLPELGIIGMGDMGRMYAQRLMKAGTCSRINVCDLPNRFEALKEEFKGTPLHVMESGHLVSRRSDFVMYSVPAEGIEAIIKEFAPSTKIGATVGGQTSTKAPEKKAFEKYAPDDTYIVSVHSLHNPTVPPDGQALVLIQHRAPDEKLRMVEKMLAPLNSRYVYLDYDEHDQVTANTQAVTHAAFLSMGTAWSNMKSFPWETGRYVRGIEIAKINITLRIYSSKWHVYAGLAILNPAAKVQIDCYAASVTQLFMLMIEEKEEELKERVFKAREKVFGYGKRGGGDGPANRTPILLSDEALDKFSIGDPPSSTLNNDPDHPPQNSHLALLAMVDCWNNLDISPFHHLSIAATPIFRMWIGVAEYIFRDESRLLSAIKAAVHDKSHRSDDAEFCIAARGWSQAVSFGDFGWYRHRFEEVAKFFESRFDEAKKVGTEMLKFLENEGREREKEAEEENKQKRR